MGKLTQVFIRLSFLFALSEPVPVRAQDTLRIGSISNEPNQELESWLPFGKYVAEKMGKVGITKVSMKVVRTPIEMATLVNRDEIDLYIDSSIIGALVCAFSKCEPLLRRWKKGLKEYESVIFVRKESDIYSPKDLESKTIAFENAYSSSGFIVPFYYLSGMNLAIEPLEKQYADPRSIKYVFSGEDENSSLWLLTGKVDAATSDNITFDSLASRVRGSLRIIYRSQKFPRHVVFVRRNFGDERKQVLRGILLKISEDQSASAVLEKFDRTTGFDEISQRNLDEIQAIVSRMKKDYEIEFLK